VVAQAGVDGEPRTARRPRPNRRGTIPQRLNYLFETVHAPGSKPYSAAEVARWINDNGGKISSVYILKILNGERTGPGHEYLKTLAEFFGVSHTYFYEDDPAEVDGAALNAAIVLRNDNVQSMLVRAARLSPQSQKALSDIIDGLLRAEGKDPEQGELD
jgi:transcriptional regulator with XRE-family HTH domain